MRYLFFFLLSLILSVGGCTSGQAQEVASKAVAGQGAQAGSDPYTFDFGRIPDDKPVSHVFTLVNNSGAELNITGKTNSCGCTSSEISKDVISPGGSIQVTVTFNPKGYKGPESQYVYLNTDDQENPVYKFTVTADVS